MRAGGGCIELLVGVLPADTDRGMGSGETEPLLVGVSLAGPGPVCGMAVRPGEGEALLDGTTQRAQRQMPRQLGHTQLQYMYTSQTQHG